MIGADLAAELGITRLEVQPGLYIGEHYFTVIGIVDEALRDRGFLGAAIITSTAAADYFGVDRPERVVVEVEIGAGELIAVQGPIALAPSAPENLAAAAPVLPQAARDRVAGDVDSLFLLLAIVSLVVGAIGIANVTLVTVMERTGEIGLRRAVGARRRHIATQFLGESAVIGLVGGVIGASIGLIVVVSVSAAKGWTPVLDPWMPLAAPLHRRPRRPARRPLPGDPGGSTRARRGAAQRLTSWRQQATLTISDGVLAFDRSAISRQASTSAGTNWSGSVTQP